MYGAFSVVSAYLSPLLPRRQSLSVAPQHSQNSFEDKDPFGVANI